MSCNITKQQIHKSLLDKSFEIALTKNKAYFINGRGEIGLMVNPKVISENTPYRVRQKIDILSRKLAKDLNIPIDKYGVVFGGKTYTDGAALEIIVTPRLLEAYQVKNNEKKIEEAFVEEAVSEVKKGVPELFESNPELANAVYEALGFKTIPSDISKIKDFEGTIIEYVEHIGTHKDGRGIGARNINKGEKIQVVLNEMRKKFEEKSWVNPVNSEPLSQDAFSSFEELMMFMYLHEKAHEYILQEEGESLKSYETRVNNEALKRLNSEFKIAPQQKQQAILLYSQYLEQTGKQDIEGFKEFISSTQTPLEKIDSKSKLKTEAKFQITKLGDGQFLYAGDIYPSREDAFRAFEEDNTPSIQEAQIPISQMDRIIDNLPPFTGDMEDLGFEEEACDL